MTFVTEKNLKHLNSLNATFVIINVIPQ